MKIRLALVGALVVALGGCEGLSEALEDWGWSAEREPLTGQNAFVHLQADATAAHRADMQAVMQVIDWQSEGGTTTDSAARFRPDENVADLLQSTARQRAAIRPRSFQTIDFTGYESETPVRKLAFDPIDVTALDDEYLIPNLDALPVRNQGSRGTCAAFAGVGHIEYFILHEYPGLQTINLSEQRFYYNSKPECQSSGCTPDDAGSWHGDGMNASMNSGGFDIPLESDCPYNSTQKPNELQTPLAPGCDDGAVQVQRIEYVLQPADMIRVLEQDGLPVPFASPLSDNFFENDGLITLAEAGSAGDVAHAGGHAYLLVGYRKLPSMPEEGGMCFVVRNSWGPGWGVGGYSCITLAWMEEWNFGFLLEQPVVADIAVRDDVVQGAAADSDELPDFVNDDVYEDETIDYDNLDDDTPIPEPEPGPADVTWVSTRLRGPDDLYYKAELAEAGSSTLHLRGILRGTGLYTGALTLARSGDDIVMGGDVVGSVKSDGVTLCTGPYDLLCSLRLDTTTNRLYVEFLYSEFRSVQASEVEGGQWSSLVGLPLAGANLEFMQPDSFLDALLSPVYVRTSDDVDGVSDPIRLTLDGLNIKAMGVPVGSLAPDNLGLCTGEYSGKCSMFKTGSRLMVLPNW